MMNNYYSLLEYQTTKINNKNAKIQLFIDTNRGLCVVLGVPNPQN